MFPAPHHDGSALHVEDEAEGAQPGDSVVVRLRVPNGAADAVTLRTVDDGEPRTIEAALDRIDEHESWWRAELHLRHPVQRHRWQVHHGSDSCWVNGAGVVEHDPTDVDDVPISTAAPAPGWARDGVVYQIFPDRFAPSPDGPPPTDVVPDWATLTAWDAPLADSHGAATRQTYGGSLWGVLRHLDHIADLGATVIWLTPFFPAGSSHRYDAASFERVDPLLGGDAALTALTAEAHRRGLRVIGDLTTNHCGSGHDWFLAAQRDPRTVEAGHFTFHDHPDDYECWLGRRSLPKFDHTDPELRRRLVDGRGSVVDRWLREPVALDGWRIDVANMTGRQGAVDVNHDVARTVRRTLDAARSDAWLVAEHAHDFTGDLDGFGWHGTMNYAGFTRPVWSWLRDPDATTSFLGTETALPRRPGPLAVRSMSAFGAPLPWGTRAASQHQLGSHDTPRWRTVAGDDDTAIVGVGLLTTLIGVPCLFAGDEFGQRGDSSDRARVPMPWDRPETWDRRLLDAHRTLLRLRRDTRALARGGLRWVHVGDDALVFLRETADDRLLVLAARAPHRPVRLPIGPLGAGSLEGLVGDDVVPVDGLVELPGDGPAFHVWRLHAR
ncbi:MAG: glycoside hydrolase family 13 protein [Actinomycetota bacterium]